MLSDERNQNERDVMSRSTKRSLLLGLAVCLTAGACADAFQQSGSSSGGSESRAVTRAAFSPDGQSLAVVAFEAKADGNGGYLVAIEGKHGLGIMPAKQSSGPRMLFPGIPGNVAFSRDGKFVVGEVESKLVRVPVSDPEHPTTIAADVSDVVFSRDGGWGIVKEGASGRYRIVNLEDGKLGPPLAGPDDVEKQRDVVDEQGQGFLLFIRTGKLVAFNLTTRAEEELADWPAARGGIAECRAGAGILAVAPEKGGNLALWSIADKKAIESKAPAIGEVSAIAIAPSGNAVAYGTRDGLVTLVDLKAGIVEAKFGMHKAPVLDASFSADGGRLVTAGIDSVRLWEVKTRPASAGSAASDAK